MLGYYAHLIEDKVWFEEFMNEYKKSPKFSNEKMYSDYALIDDLIFKKLNMNSIELGNRLISAVDKINTEEICLMYPHDKKILTNEKIKLKVKEIWKEYKTTGENYFYTQEDSEKYYKIAIEEVEKLIKETKEV